MKLKPKKAIRCIKRSAVWGLKSLGDTILEDEFYEELGGVVENAESVRRAFEAVLTELSETIEAAEEILARLEKLDEVAGEAKTCVRELIRRDINAMV
jgi:hypothetical protein